MAAELLPYLNRATDSNDNPLSGAKFYFYVTGTTTPQAVYTDDTLATPHTNPVIADSAGLFAEIYLDSSLQYRGVLKTSDDVTTVLDIDPINAGVLSQLALSTGAASIGSNDGESGSWWTTVAGALTLIKQRALNGVFTLEEYDATGGTDYAAAWTAAKAAISTNGGGVLQLKDTTYPITGNAVVDIPNMSVVGQGANSLLSCSGGAFRIDAKAAGENITGVMFRDFGVERTGTAHEVLTSTVVSGDIFTVADHGLATGWEIVPQSSDNGLTSGTTYYSIRVDANSFKVATSLVNADAGTAVTLSGTTNMTFHFPEVGAFEVIGDDTATPQYALIRSVIDNVLVENSTANGFVFRGGGYQYAIGRIGTVEITRRAMFVDVGEGNNTAWNAITIAQLELRNGSAGRTDAVTYTEQDSIWRGVRNITVGTLLIQGSAGFVIGEGCQNVDIQNIYSELALSPDHSTDMVIGETGRTTPIAIRLGLQRWSDGSDAIGRSGKDHALKLVRCTLLEVGNVQGSGYADTYITNIYDSASLVEGTYGAANGGTMLDTGTGNAANQYFVPKRWKDRILSGSATYNAPSIAAGGRDTFTITVTGAVAGAFCQVGTAQNLQGLTISAACRAADTVEVTLANNTGGAIDLPNATYRALADNHANYF